MEIVNNRKFAETDAEFTASLFDTGGTCKGYIKKYKRSIVFLNSQKTKVGCINRYGVIGSISKLDNGKYLYSNMFPDILGKELNLIEQDQIIKNLSIGYDINGLYIFK